MSRLFNTIFHRKSLLVAFLAGCVIPGIAQSQKIDSLQTALKTAKDTIEVNVLNELSEAHRKLKPVEAIAYAEKALAKAEALNFERGLMMAFHNVGLAYGFNNDFPKANHFLLKSAELAEKRRAYKTAANDYTNVGSIYSLQGNNEKWLEYYLKAFHLYEKAGDKKGMGSVLYGIGNTFTNEKKYDQALENFFKSIEYFEELGEKGELPKVYVNVGRLYEEQKDYTQALAYYEKALGGFQEFNNRRGRANSLLARANTYFLQHHYDLALDDLNESIQISQESNYQVAILESTILMGKVQQARRQYDLAILHLQDATTLAKKMRSNSNLSTIHELLADLYYSKGDFKNAFLHQGLHASYNDSTFNAEKSRQIQEMQFRFETEKKEREIETLKRDRFLNSIYLATGGGGVVLVLIIGLLIFNSQKLKIRNERELSQKENQILEERKALIEAELLNRKLNEEHLGNLIDFKNKEMTTYTLNLIQKNELLDNIKENIEEIRYAETDQIKPKLQSLLNTVNFSFHLDKDWENFKMHFEQVHQSFYDKLRDLYPDLGANDIKLSALIRLNLDTKSMATVLDISPESAKVARHRLRKKLNLPSEQNLTSFLSRL